MNKRMGITWMLCLLLGVSLAVAEDAGSRYDAWLGRERTSYKETAADLLWRQTSGV